MMPPVFTQDEIELVHNPSYQLPAKLLNFDLSQKEAVKILKITGFDRNQRRAILKTDLSKSALNFCLEHKVESYFSGYTQSLIEQGFSRDQAIQTFFIEHLLDERYKPRTPWLTYAFSGALVCYGIQLSYYIMGNESPELLKLINSATAATLGLTGLGGLLIDKFVSKRIKITV